jgi:hypothetical protein
MERFLDGGAVGVATDELGEVARFEKISCAGLDSAKRGLRIERVALPHCGRLRWGQ